MKENQSSPTPEDSNDAKNSGATLPHDLLLEDKWDTSQLRRLVDQRCQEGRKPSHLFLGKKETSLLRQHLGEAFGDENVQQLTHLFYMGLRVVELQAESLSRLAGEKFLSKLDDEPEHLSSLKSSDVSRWRFDWQ